MLMVFHSTLSDSKFLQVFWTLLNILTDFNDDWMVTTRPPISNPSSLLSKPLETITIVITFTLAFHSFFSSLVRSLYLPLFSFYLIFNLWSAETANPSIQQVFVFAVFHWRLRDSKSSQVSRTLLGILADLNNSVIMMVMARPLISKSSSEQSKFWEIIQNAEIFYYYFTSLRVFNMMIS